MKDSSTRFFAAAGFLITLSMSTFAGTTFQPPATEELNLKPLGGWRISSEYSRGGIAIDYANSKLYMVGHAHRNEVNEFHLPAHGTGTDINNWPRLDPVRVIKRWWPAEEGYANGLIWHKGKLWAAPRVFYDMKPPSVTKIYATDGEVITIPIPRQQFAGFVKSASEFEIGCGGYESGQGSAFGPTLATVAGKILINHSFKGTWEQREKREPNYHAANEKDWVAITPKKVDGILEGRWACDRVYGGGIRQASGVYYWPLMGIGDINYRRQNTTFAAANKTYQYRYDPTTYKLLGWKEMPGLGSVLGQEISPDGQRIYLCEGDAWTSGRWKAAPVVRLFQP